MDIDKMNDCLFASIRSQKNCDIIERTFKAIADFTSSHMTDEAGRLLKERSVRFDRAEIISMMIDDMYVKIFENHEMVKHD